MMTAKERLIAIGKMHAVSDYFYSEACKIGNHPFIEFCGLMNEYIKLCEQAHKAGIDFSECNIHAGQHLPMHPFNISYINEKLGCIFTGRSIMSREEIQKGSHVNVESTPNHSPSGDSAT